MEVETPATCVRVLVRREYPHFIYQKELHETPDGENNLEMKMAYARNNGVWIGSPREARLLTGKYGIREFHKTHQNSCCATIGFSPEKKQ